MKARKRSEPAEPLYPTEEVFVKGGPQGDFGGEEIRGADGRLIYPGRTVRMPSFRHPKWGKVPSRVGVVKRLFREPGKPQVIVETEDGHFFLAILCRRSSARR